MMAAIFARPSYGEVILEFSSSCPGTYQHFLDKAKPISTLFLSFEAAVAR